MVEHLTDDAASASCRAAATTTARSTPRSRRATEHTGQPTVILAHTIKGWTLGHGLRGAQRDAPDEEADRRRAQGRSATGSTSTSATRRSRATCRRTTTRASTATRSQYMQERRAALGGSLPRRVVRAKPLPQPAGRRVVRRAEGRLGQAGGRDDDGVRPAAQGPDEGQGASAARIVPIIPDEARTFGMDSMFPTPKIYSPARPALRGRRPRAAAVLQGVRDRARSCTRASPRPARWRRCIAAGTSYATHGEHMIPVYVFYSMFGFQRIGDSIWAFGRPARPRLPARRDRRPHDAQRRGAAAPGRPLAAARVDQPGVRRLRPGLGATRSRSSSRTACAGCTAEAPRTSSTT